MVTRVNLLHFNLCVNVTVGEKVDIGVLDLRYSVFVTYHCDNVIEGKERVTLDLGEDVLSHGAAGEELDQLDVIAKRATVVHAVPLTPHHLEEVVEGGAVVVEDENLVTSVEKFLHDKILASSYELILCVDNCL